MPRAFMPTATISVFSLFRIPNSLPSTACAGAAFRSLRLRNDPCRSGPPPHLLFRTSARPEEPKSFVERRSRCLSPPFLTSIPGILTRYRAQPCFKNRSPSLKRNLVPILLLVREICLCILLDDLIWNPRDLHTGLR